jgi:Uma2 family endonuclease
MYADYHAVPTSRAARSSQRGKARSVRSRSGSVVLRPKRGSVCRVTLVAPHRRVEPEEFLAWERLQPERHFYVRGEVFAMAGGSPRHSMLASRVIMLLGERLRGRPCDVHTSDLRLGIDAEHFVYADAAIVCRPIERRPGTTDVVTNPKVVIEVLSKGTEGHDRGEKQAGYLALPSLEYFVLVSQREPRVEIYARQADGSFRFTVHGPGSRVELDRIGATMEVDDVYTGAFELPGDEASAR